MRKQQGNCGGEIQETKQNQSEAADANGAVSETESSRVDMGEPSVQDNHPDGGVPVVYMTADISAKGLMAVYEALGASPIVRIISCFLCGSLAGVLVRVFYGRKSFFDFSGFEEPKSRDTDPNLLFRFLKNLGRNVKATGGWFFLGIVLSVLFQRHVPAELMTDIFGGNQAFGVLMSATIGVPLYACGGGTIPLLQGWLLDGMSLGSAAAFMITGPATKITNLGAVKIVLGIRRFALYIAYVMGFSFLSGLTVNFFF